MAPLLRVSERRELPPHLEGCCNETRAWAASPSSCRFGETGDFLHRFVCRPPVVGGIVLDARIVVIGVAHGVEALLTRERDFSLFPEVQTRARLLEVRFARRNRPLLGGDAEPYM